MSTRKDNSIFLTNTRNILFQCNFLRLRSPNTSEKVSFFMLSKWLLIYGGQVINSLIIRILPTLTFLQQDLHHVLYQDSFSKNVKMVYAILD